MEAILARVRGGGAAFAHAGEAEVIETALADIPKDDCRARSGRGYGLGGTADYMSRQGSAASRDLISTRKAWHRRRRCSRPALSLSPMRSAPEAW